MNIAVIIIMLISLLFILVQDIKYRHIHFVFPLVIFLCSCFLLLREKKSFVIVAYNIAFFLITLLLLVGYMSLKNRNFANPFKNYFGIGDVAFYISIAPVFFLNNYVVFFILSLLFALIMQFLFIKKQTVSTVPLAGFASLLLILVIISDLFIDTNSFTTLLLCGI